MKKSGIRLLALFLIIALHGGTVPTEADTVDRSSDFEYTILKDGTASITKYTGSASSLIIPEVLGDRPVTSISEFAFMNCSSFVDLTIPNSITSIEWAAFSSCKGFTNLIIPDSVTSLGDGAFGFCEKLESVTIGKGVEKIGGNPFSGCDSLTTISLASDHPTLELIGGVLFLKPEKSLVYYPYSLSARTYDIPEGINSIAAGAFCANINLTSLTIPGSVTSMGVSAFTGCKGLTSLDIPDSVTSLGDFAFSGCTSLTDVKLPNTVTSFGHGAFLGCSSLIDITIPNIVISIGNMAFNRCISLESIIIPDSITNIGDDAFSNCISLESVILPNNVTDIGKEAFSGCDKLTLAVGRDSYALEYAISNNIPYEYVKVQEMQILRNGENMTGKTLAIDLSADTAPIALQVNTWPANALQEFVWASSAPQVATVDANGQVTVLAKGKATITAVATDGSEKKASCMLGVLTLVKEVVISGENAVASGMKITLTASVLPETADNRKVQWSTSNSNLATVSDGGVVTAKKVTEASEVVITAAAKDGSGRSTSHVITICPLVSGLVLKSENEIFDSKSTLLIDLGASNKTQQLLVDIAPADSSQSVTWKSSDPKIASVDEAGLVIGLKKGTTTITATAADGSKVKVSVKMSVTYLAKEIAITGSGELKAGKQTILKAAVLPAETIDKKVAWNSSDTTVATVSTGGVVTAKKVTETKKVTITAITKDGSEILAGFVIMVTP